MLTNSLPVKVRRLVTSKWLWLFTVLAVLLVAGLVIASTLIISRYERYVLRDATAMERHGARVGIVLGAGVTSDGRPFRELQSRLDTAADALHKGYVDKLVLSGDNRFDDYNEPDAMHRYLIEERGVATDKLQPDYAGRSTYESCERASKVFQLDKAVIFSAGSHLPRAIYLCRHFGVEAYGIASTAEANNAGRREALARVKAVFNVHINGENTILGAPIKF